MGNANFADCTYKKEFMDISVIVPLYNEAESLPELEAWIERVMKANGFSYEIIFVNDGSTDASWKVINDLKAYTARVLKDGVYHTGDLGRINEKGRLVLLKRNPEIILLPTGEKISRTVTIREITALDGVSESYVTLYNDKLTALIVPIDKEARIDRFVRLINRYNERKGFRWEIQKVKLIKEPLPRLDNGDIDQDAVDDLMVDLTDVG